MTQTSDLVRFAHRARRVEEAAPSAGEAWYVYQRVFGRRRGTYLGPFDGPDAAIGHLSDLVEWELLLLDQQTPSSSTFRVVRRTSSELRT